MRTLGRFSSRLQNSGGAVMLKEWQGGNSMMSLSRGISLPRTTCSGTSGPMSHVREILLFSLFRVRPRAACVLGASPPAPKTNWSQTRDSVTQFETFCCIGSSTWRVNLLKLGLIFYVICHFKDLFLKPASQIKHFPRHS